jgi:hypothetical protein
MSILLAALVPPLAVADPGYALYVLIVVLIIGAILSYIARGRPGYPEGLGYWPFGSLISLVLLLVMLRAFGIL